MRQRTVAVESFERCVALAVLLRAKLDAEGNTGAAMGHWGKPSAEQWCKTMRSDARRFFHKENRMLRFWAAAADVDPLNLLEACERR